MSQKRCVLTVLTCLGVLLFLTHGCVLDNADALAKVQANLNADLHTKITGLESEILAEMNNEIVGLKADVNTKINSEVTGMKNDISVELENNFKVDFDSLLKTSARDINAKVSSEITGVKSDFKNEMRTMISGEITGIKAQLNSEINGIKAEVKTDLSAYVNTQLSVKGAELNTQMTAMENKLVTSVEQHIKQSFESFKGEMNIGPFSGGAIYVTVVACVLIIGLAIVIVYLSKSVSSWKQVFEDISTVIGDASKKGENREVVEEIKEKFKERLLDTGTKRMVDNNLRLRGLK